MKLLVTIDTEENWEGPGSLAIPNVSNVYEIPRLQEEYFDEFGIKPVYLVTFPVATDSKCIDILKMLYRKGKCEIGAHLHNWNSSPFTEKDVFEKSYQFRLPYNVEKQKIKDLTDVIEKNIGTRPVSFRAGRWGADGETIKILLELGYKIDLSITPLTDHSQYDGMNFMDAPFDPYFPSVRDITLPDTGSENRTVLEIPVPYGFSRPNFEMLGDIYKYLLKRCPRFLHIMGLLYKLNLLKKIRLSPELSSFREIKELTNACLARKTPVLHLTFHSSMISAGNSPYAKDKKERDRRLKILRDSIEYIVSQKNIKPVTSLNYYEEYTKI
jgi:peptidoglycan/xylan/chitin deacetylase (PgdA/CDA1 family)